MKKLILVVAMMFVLEGAAFSAFTGEINLKAGLEAPGIVSLDEKVKMKVGTDTDPREKENACTGIGADLLCECLFPANDSIKIGVGLGYLYPRKISKAESKNLTFSYLPLYCTAQINPISSAKGVFFKGNVGLRGFLTALEMGYSLLRQMTIVTESS
ncbi:hypothetical protein AGMMS49921_12660 [Endomicrobiia bacterium]|nr:hypothetical protein AGMMS49921_12660 [Endomicrobiia bacterium]